MKVEQLVISWIMFVLFMMVLIVGAFIFVIKKGYQAIDRPDGMKGAIEEVWNGTGATNGMDM